GRRARAGRQRGRARPERVLAHRRRADKRSAQLGARAVARFPGPRRADPPRRPGAELTDVATMMDRIGRAALEAARTLATVATRDKNAALTAAADELRRRCAAILASHAADRADARAEGLGAAMLDRLAWNDARVEAMARGLEDIAALEDPIGAVTDEWLRPNGLRIQRVRVPLGVIGI